MACFFGHKWNGCKCDKCGKIRDAEHEWDGCKCGKCGKEREDGHKWEGCKCAICGKSRDEGHDWADGKCRICGKIDVGGKFIVFIAYVGAAELQSLYGLRATKDMIGIDKINWNEILLNKYPAAKSMAQAVINNNEWAHPQSGNIDSKIDLNDFLTAATKHMTDKMNVPPDAAINAIMVTANNNITVAASNGMGLGQGFVVIGVPFA